MSLKCFIICATLAIARAGYLQPAISAVPTITAVPTIRYAHSVTPVEIPQPPITYSVPPKAYAESLPPVITTSYGYRSEHTPVPAPIIRTEPVHVAPTPAILPAPAIHARVGFAAPAPIATAPLPLPALGYAGHFGAGPLALGAGYATGHGLDGYSLGAGYATGLGLRGYSLGAGYATGLGLGGYSLGAPATFGYAGHLGGYGGGYRIAAPAPLTYPAHIGLPATTPLAFGKSYTTDFGLGYGRHGGW